MRKSREELKRSANAMVTLIIMLIILVGAIVLLNACGDYGPRIEKIPTTSMSYVSPGRWPFHKRTWCLCDESGTAGCVKAAEVVE